jgi:hypothetical protein
MSRAMPSARAGDPSDRSPQAVSGKAAIPIAVSGLGAGKSNDWHTPRSVFAALGCHFDLDVSAPLEGPLHTPCAAWFGRAALERPWSGFVWMNPPFGGRNGLAPWLTKFFDHGNGIALTPDRTSAPWFREAWARTDAVLFTAGKTRFLLRDGAEAGCPAFGTALWASGERGAVALRSAAAKGFGLLAIPAQGCVTEGRDGEAGSVSEANSTRSASADAPNSSPPSPPQGTTP